MGSGLASRAAEISRATSTAAEDEGRFVPGTLLGGRYRIIGLLGRGGMGEVYRATDLTLGQSVALKFLPEEASRNQRLLERFHGEVRVARLVSHPERLPRLRYRRDRRHAVHLHGVRGRRRSRFPAPAHRPAARRQGRRDGAQTLRRTRRGARSRRDPSRPEAAEHHDEQARRSRHHGLRTGRDCRSALRRRSAQRHAGLHGAGAVERLRRHRQKRYLCAGPGALRTLHRQAALRRAERPAADRPAGLASTWRA